MKKYLYKSTFLIIIYSLIAMLVNLGSIAYIKHINDFKAFPELSNEYAVGAATSADDNDMRELLIESFRQSEGDYLLASEFTQIDAYAVYYTTSKYFPLKLSSGRIFTEKDFQNKSNTVLIREDIQNKCFKQNGSLYWDYGGAIFRVIGIYPAVDKTGSKAPECFLNLQASNLASSIFSSFIYDAHNKTLSNLEKVDQVVENLSDANLFEYAVAASDEAEEFDFTTTNFTTMFMMLLLTIVLIVINSSSAVYNWLLVRKREIAVRKMVGASDKDILFWLGKGILFLVMMSYCIGSFASKCILEIGLQLPTKESVQLMFGLETKIEAYFSGCFAVFFLCGLTVAVTVYTFRKKEIVRMLA